MSTGKILLGLLAGIAAGATLGILFAPDKGSSVRKKISDKGDDYFEALNGKFNTLIDGISRKIDMAKAEADKAVHNGKVKADQIDSKVAEATK